eukprot:CFRG6115T1
MMKSSSFKYLSTNVYAAIYGVTALAVIADKVFSFKSIKGASMEPTMYNHDWTIVLYWNPSFTWLNYKYYKPRRGEIVMIRSPIDPKELVVKRIIGLDGDIIRKRPSAEAVESKRIMPGQMWVEGDNLIRSEDSNKYGQIPINLIEGRVAWVIYPWARFGRVSLKPPPETRFVRRGSKYE